MSLKIGDDRWHCFEDEDDNPTLARAQKDLWHIWRREFTNIDDMNVKEPIRFEDIPRGAQVLPQTTNLSTKRYSSVTLRSSKRACCCCCCCCCWEIMADSQRSLFAHSCKETLLAFLHSSLGPPRHILIHEMHNVVVFLYSKLEEPVYCKLPPECRDVRGNFIYWKLLKALAQWDAKGSATLP